MSAKGYGTSDLATFWRLRAEYLSTRLHAAPPQEPEACFWTLRDLESIAALAERADDPALAARLRFFADKASRRKPKT